ncbi:MAG: glycosyltransferase family 2 protein [Planctomycetota bacterium]|jgi:glycosyltransferase involved in cell wall biosynthesis
MKITACIITKNEADRVRPCLESVAFCDEVIVVDSGSTDGTPDICRAAGARVIETSWPGWIAQKNRAAGEAAHDWILSVDADERVDDVLREEIEKLRSESTGEGAGPAAYEVNRRTRFLGRWLRYGGTYPEWRTRLYDRRRARWGHTEPHERIEVDGEAERIREGHLDHHTFRSLEDHVARMNTYTTLMADRLAAEGKHCTFWAPILRPPLRFLVTYVLRLGFLDGWAGYVSAYLSAKSVFLKYAKLWERERVDAAPRHRL